MPSSTFAPVSQVPDARGRFGPYGGRFVPETLMFALEQLDAAYREAKADPAFQAEFHRLLNEYVGRPSPLYFAERLTKEAGGARIYLKREDLNHTGAHKINNALGQALLTQRMGKKRVIAETGAGQHGVATATAAALFGLPCRVYMGSEDVRRQELNVFRMRAMGTEVVPGRERQPHPPRRHQRGDARLDEQRRAHALHHRQRRRAAPVPDDGPRFPERSSAARPKQQCLEQIGRLPDVVVACVGGGSNAAGMFYPFVDDTAVELVGVEAGGRGHGIGEHAATLSYGKPGVLHGSFSYVLQDDDGQTADVHSVSAGLDYPGVGPEHSYWKDTRPRPLLQRDRRGGAGRLPPVRPAGRHPAGAGNGPRRGRGDAHRRRSGQRRMWWWSASRGRGDKDCAEVARLTAKK